MKNHWRKILSFLPDSIQRKAFENFNMKEHRQLQQHNPAGADSNITKQQRLRKLQQQYHINTLVETGTYLGDTLFALYPDFNQLYSIELSDLYYQKAVKRFSNYPNIRILKGDSGVELKKLVPQLSASALFWLDGHYSGGLTAKGQKECPIYDELDAIFASPFKHVIVIDDARLFVGRNDYPTVKELEDHISLKQAPYRLKIDNDSIIMLPK